MSARHQTRWELAVTCETCGLIGHCSSFEELTFMRARHEEQDRAKNALDSVSQETEQDFSFQDVAARHSLTLAIERKEICHSLNR